MTTMTTITPENEDRCEYCGDHDVAEQHSNGVLTCSSSECSQRGYRSAAADAAELYARAGADDAQIRVSDTIDISALSMGHEMATVSLGTGAARRLAEALDPFRPNLTEVEIGRQRAKLLKAYADLYRWLDMTEEQAITAWVKSQDCRFTKTDDIWAMSDQDRSDFIADWVSDEIYHAARDIEDADPAIGAMVAYAISDGSLEFAAGMVKEAMLSMAAK